MKIIANVHFSIILWIHEFFFFLKMYDFNSEIAQYKTNNPHNLIYSTLVMHFI